MTLRLQNSMTNQDSKRLARRGPRGGARGPARLETTEQRRERIIRLAWPLFLKKGYDNVSIDEIIGVVGGSKATIYAWFGGKEGLFEAVVRQKCRDVVVAIHVDTTGSLEAQLTEIGQSFLAMVLSPPCSSRPARLRLTALSPTGSRSSKKPDASSRRIRIGSRCCFSTC